MIELEVDFRSEQEFEFEHEFEFDCSSSRVRIRVGFQIELKFEIVLQIGFVRALNVDETQFRCPGGSVSVSESVFLGNFRGLGIGHLQKFGLPETGPDLGSWREPKSSDSSSELLANSRILGPLAQAAGRAPPPHPLNTCGGLRTNFSSMKPSDRASVMNPPFQNETPRRQAGHGIIVFQTWQLRRVV